jgi:hypothetical protein
MMMGFQGSAKKRTGFQVSAKKRSGFQGSAKKRACFQGSTQDYGFPWMTMMHCHCLTQKNPFLKACPRGWQKLNQGVVKITAFFQGFCKKMGFFLRNIQRSILLLAHWERLFFRRIREEGAGFDFVIGK